MPSNPTPATLTSPQLLDHAFGQVNDHISAMLAWLDAAYGKAERLVRLEDRQEVVYPAIYADNASGKEYLSVFPDEHLGDFSFWFVGDGWQVSNYDPYREHKFQIQASLIFWYDLRNVFPVDWKQRTNQNVLRLVIQSLRTLAIPDLRLEITRIWEETPNIYRGFTHQEIKNQFRMRPYGGFRLECLIDYREPCDPMKFEGVNYWIVENDNIVQ